MDEKKLAVILGALLHDIGKFMQRAEVPLSKQSKGMENSVCPVYQGRYSHKHVLWTNEFFEQYFQAEIIGMPTVDMGNLACYHHRPDTPLQWIIAEADRLSSGDRMPKDEEDEITKRDKFKRVRLYPVLEEVSINGKQEEKINNRIELKKLSLDKNDIFPANIESLVPEEGALLVTKYNDLWQEFIKEFTKISNNNISAFIETTLFLLEKYTWCIPSSTMDFPDVSLFDHSKTTAAIAACLYEYHNANDTITEKHIKNRDTEKYLLVCGDISGIQKFIYNITSKAAAKGLKGRSFLLQLLMDAAGKYFLRSLDYPLTNLLYASGGKFYLLIASGHEDALTKIRDEINRNLLRKYNGELYFALGWCSLKGSDFDIKNVNFSAKWKEASQEANKQKQQKFSKLSYKEIFAPFGIGEKEPTCAVCKKEGDLEQRRKDDPDRLCPDCREAEKLGKNLFDADFLIEVFDENIEPEEPGFYFEFLKTRYYLSRDSKYPTGNEARNVSIYRLNSTDFLAKYPGTAFYSYGFKFIGGTYLPCDSKSEALTFNDFADQSKGLKRLGVLRMDVDNLGRIFTKGLSEKASISRVTTLSRSLVLFFGGYLNTICKQEKYRNNVSIIYSGGDDLFIIGAWSFAIELAKEIKSEFGAFCNNPTFTISGGLSITPKKYPIYRSANHAGDAEKKAKNLKRKDEREKDAFTFLNKPLCWNDFEVAVNIKNLLYDCIENGKSSIISNNENIRMSKGILDRLRRIYLLYEKNRTYWQGKKSLTPELIKEKIGYHKWVWRSVYSLDKAERENSHFKEELSLLKTALFENRFEGKHTEKEVIEFIDIPARWAEFMLREE